MPTYLTTPPVVLAGNKEELTVMVSVTTQEMLQNTGDGLADLIDARLKQARRDLIGAIEAEMAI